MSDDAINEGEPERKRRREEAYDDDRDAPNIARPRRANDGGMGIVVPYRNVPALIAYYWGVFGLIGCFLGLGFLGIVPIILGFMGLMRKSQDPEAHGTLHAWAGIVLGLVQVVGGCLAPAGFFAYMAMQEPARRR